MPPVLPSVVLFYASSQPFFRPPSINAFQTASLHSYEVIFRREEFWIGLKNTLVLIAVVPFFTILFSAVISWVVVRTKARGRGLLDTLAFIPFTAPSIVFGLAFLLIAFWIDWIPLYGTIWLIVLVHLSRFLAYGTRTTNGAMFQLHSELGVVPKDIYDDPNSRFTAEFIGTANLLEGTITSHEGNVMHIETPQGMLRCDAVDALNVGDKAAVAIRPANIAVYAERQPADNVIEGTVETLVFLGDSQDCRIDVGGVLLRAYTHAAQLIARGDHVYLTMGARDCRLLPPEAAFVEAEEAGSAVRIAAQAPSSVG